MSDLVWTSKRSRYNVLAMGIFGVIVGTLIMTSEVVGVQLMGSMLFGVSTMALIVSLFHPVQKCGKKREGD